MSLSLSIPFVGFFSMHPSPVQPSINPAAKTSFNSLCGIFLYASFCLGRVAAINRQLFQFPLWDFSLCIICRETPSTYSFLNFQFPLWDFSLCITFPVFRLWAQPISFQFPLWDFSLCILLIASYLNLTGLHEFVFQFPLWDFSLCIRNEIMAKIHTPTKFFQFPLWDFSLCIVVWVPCISDYHLSFQFPLWDFSLCISRVRP